MATAVGFALLSAEGALGTSGEFLRAQANADWTLASIAGTVDWTESCEEPVLGEAPVGAPPPPLSPLCIWTPYVTLGPASSEADCASPDRVLEHLGEGVQVVWLGDERTEAGSVSFDLPAVQLDSGEASQLLCLSAAETRYKISCGWLGAWECVGDIRDLGYQLDAALLESSAEADPPPTEPPAAAPKAPAESHAAVIDLSAGAPSMTVAGSTNGVAPAIHRNSSICRVASVKRRGQAHASRGKRGIGKRCKHGRDVVLGEKN